MPALLFFGCVRSLLGYNRRALNFKRVVEAAVERYGSALPKAVEELEDLPAIGRYTARVVVH
jgi:adenine-specific DNA glycosylase